MTSTSFNIGLASEKNSSRVLRPPGGGHSDIFGVQDNGNEIVTPSKKRNQPQSTIGNCFNMVEETKEQEIEQNMVIMNGEQTVNGNAVNGKEGHEVDNGIDENTAPSELQEDTVHKPEEAQTPSAKRVRVPPGGFSSGFW